MLRFRFFPRVVRSLLLSLLPLVAAAALAQQPFCGKSSPAGGGSDPITPPGADFTFSCDKAPADTIASHCTFVPSFAPATLALLQQYSWNLSDPRNDNIPPIFYTPQPYIWTFQSPIVYRATMTYWLRTGDILNVIHDVTIRPVPLTPYFAYTTSFGLCVTLDTPAGDSSAYRYHWTVGDAELPDRFSKSVSRVFDGPGNYTVSLEMYRIDGTDTPQTFTRVVPVANMQPISNFTMTRDPNDARLFTFDASTSRDEPAAGPPRVPNCVGSFTNAAITSFDWDFGDGSVASGLTTTHRYTAGGSYTVTLKTTDRNGSVGSWSWPNITVPNQTPAAAYTFDCSAGLTCTFDATPSSDDHGIVSYNWNFPDGTVTTTTPRTTKTFPATGQYSVGLTVSDGSLISPVATRSMRVTNEVAAASYYFPLLPCRLYDSRTALQPLAAGEVRTITVAPSINCSIPGGATAVAMSFTAVSPQGDGFIALTPAGSSVQSYLHATKARGSRTNDASIKLTNGAVSFRSGMNLPTDLVVDITGYYAPSGAGPYTFTPVPQCRMLDSRNDPTQQLHGSAPVFLTLRQNTNCTVPFEAAALAVNLTIAGGSAAAEGGVTLQPAPANKTVRRPPTWTLFAHGPQLPTRAGGIVSLDGRTGGEDTEMDYFGDTVSTLDAVVDLMGYFRPSGVAGGLRYYPITPCRAIDGIALQPAVPASGQIQGNCGIPRGASAVMANVTAARFTTGTSVWVTPAAQPFAYVTLTYQPGEFAVANGAILPLSDLPNDLTVKSDGDPVVIVDVLGYFAQ